MPEFLKFTPKKKDKYNDCIKLAEIKHNTIFPLLSDASQEGNTINSNPKHRWLAQQGFQLTLKYSDLLKYSELPDIYQYYKPQQTMAFNQTDFRHTSLENMVFVYTLDIVDGVNQQHLAPLNLKWCFLYFSISVNYLEWHIFQEEVNTYQHRLLKLHCAPRHGA